MDNPGWYWSLFSSIFSNICIFFKLIRRYSERNLVFFEEQNTNFLFKPFWDEKRTSEIPTLLLDCNYNLL